MTTEDKTECGREEVEHQLEHCEQRFSWDCGVACVMMLLPDEQRALLRRRLSDVCREEGFHQSTWTIDLCYLLKRFGIPHVMYTTMLGVNEDHKKHSYYSKIIDLDRERVIRRFASAAGAGLRVARRALSDAELAAHVRRQGPALLLLDAGRLACDRCRRNRLRAELRRWVGGSYRGHYVVVVGQRGGRMLYRDPAVRARPPRGAHVCAAPARTLRDARQAPGTDHDAVLVYRDYRFDVERLGSSLKANCACASQTTKPALYYHHD